MNLKEYMNRIELLIPNDGTIVRFADEQEFEKIQNNKDYEFNIKEGIFIPESNDEFDTILPTLNNEKLLIDLGFQKQSIEGMTIYLFPFKWLSAISDGTVVKNITGDDLIFYKEEYVTKLKFTHLPFGVMI